MTRRVAQDEVGADSGTPQEGALVAAEAQRLRRRAVYMRDNNANAIVGGFCEEVIAALDSLLARVERVDDLIGTAWGIIANAGEGNWDRETPEWKDAAERWRDHFHTYLDERPK